MVFLKEKKLQPLSLYLPQLQKDHLGFTLAAVCDNDPGIADLLA